MSNQYQAAAEVLKGAIAALNAILTKPEDEMHRIKLTQSLQREADYLLLVTGAGDVTENLGTVLGNATTIGGKPIAKLSRITERDLRPSDDKVLDLKDQVESALVYFGPHSDSAGILANIPDIVIRGVAKKVGLQVTKQKPEILTVEFINQIKTALEEKELVPYLNLEEKRELLKSKDPLNDDAGKIQPVIGEGGIGEVHTIPAENIGAPMGTGVVMVDDPLAVKPASTESVTDETKQESKPKPETDTKKKQAGK